jgi:hypothetical protein
MAGRKGIRAVNSAVIARPACLWRENPNRLASLWDIMNRYKAADFCIRVANFAVFEARFQHANPSNVEDWAQLFIEFAGQIIHAANDCHDIGMTNAWEEIDRVNSGLALALNMHDARASATAALHIRHCLIAELGKRKFLYVRPEYSWFVDSDALLGDPVKQAFPSAAFDIRESGNCLASELHTAAVFHLMRSVEWGLRALGTDLGIRRLRCKNKKTGKTKYLALPWAQWEDIINQIKSRIATRILKAQRGPKKQAYQEFYNPSIDNIERFKDAYRNHVMHTRREYTPTEALVIFEQVRYFMERLSTRLSEC